MTTKRWLIIAAVVGIAGLALLVWWRVDVAMTAAALGTGAAGVGLRRVRSRVQEQVRRESAAIQTAAAVEPDDQPESRAERLVDLGDPSRRG